MARDLGSEARWQLPLEPRDWEECFPEGQTSGQCPLLAEPEVVAERAEALPSFCGARRCLQGYYYFTPKPSAILVKNDADSCLVVILMISMEFTSRQAKRQCCVCRGWALSERGSDNLEGR